MLIWLLKMVLVSIVVSGVVTFVLAEIDQYIQKKRAAKEGS